MKSNVFIFYCLIISCLTGVLAQLPPLSLDFAGSRRPGTTCTFNPCTIPNFCGTGRVCKINEHCVSKCQCLEDSIHPDCDTNEINKQTEVSDTLSLVGNKLSVRNDDKNIKENGNTDLAKAAVDRISQSTDRNQSTLSGNVFSERPTANTSEQSGCMFDPCATMSWLCDGGRKCINRDCIVHCECTGESTHITCIDDAQRDVNDTDDCGGFAGMTCNHGQCIQIGDAFSCKCDPDWRGALCDQHVSTGCTRQCENGYECTWYMDTLQICKPRQVTQSAEDQHSQNSTNQPIIFDVCQDGYTHHLVSSRNCSEGVLCEYGVCVNDDDGLGELSFCRCDTGALGPLCNQTCCKDCGVGGECYIDGIYGNEMCRCRHNFTGVNCTEIRRKEGSVRWVVWLVGACSALLVILIVLLVIIPYVMWKHRVIPVMKAVHYFQGYEDDDGREWDVFISYKASPRDEDFVTRVLFPTLEREFNYKLYSHRRDFIPGNTITTNIIRAVKGSRRTILIITPDYVKGDYTKLEYQLALQQVHQQKHRVIPILLEDISDHESALDSNLKSILTSVKYLKWPGDNSEKHLGQFWKRLHLDLPKKRYPNNRNNILDRPQVPGRNITNGVPIQQQTGKSQQNGIHSPASPNLQLQNERSGYHKSHGISRL